MGLALNRAPLSNLVTKSTYKNGWDKVTRFLGNLKSKGELRKMSDKEMEEYEKENIYMVQLRSLMISILFILKKISQIRKSQSPGMFVLDHLGS